MSSPLQEGRGIYHGDARNTASFLDGVLGVNETITTTITSPPYAQMKDYGVPGQIGHGQTYEEYLLDCQEIFESIYSRTAADGSLWLIADTFMDQGGSPSKLVTLPFNLANVAERAGWTLRDVIIWRKDRTLPWSRPGQLRNGFEYVLFLVKSPRFKYALDALRSIDDLAPWWVKWPERYSPLGKAPTNVWDIPIPVQGSWNQAQVRHACPLPPPLVERLVRLSTEPGDIVFDPFAGTGTVLTVAERLGRRGLGTELNKAYIASYTSAAPAEQPSLVQADLTDFARRLVALRATKYPKVLYRRLRSLDASHAADVQAIVCLHDETGLDYAEHFLGSVEILVAYSGSLSRRKELQGILSRLTTTRPLSKFGFKPSVRTLSVRMFTRDLADAELTLYIDGHTWHAAGTGSVHNLLDAPSGRVCVPIGSNVHVVEKPDC